MLHPKCLGPVASAVMNGKLIFSASLRQTIQFCFFQQLLLNVDQLIYHWINRYQFLFELFNKVVHNALVEVIATKVVITRCC